MLSETDDEISIRKPGNQEPEEMKLFFLSWLLGFLI
jgi:hypothetical protein